jgi:hypothetical protein
MPVPEAYALIAELGYKLGLRDLAKKPGAWIYRLDDDWTFALNPHSEPQHVGPDLGMVVDVPRYTAAVWWHGWLAGFLDPAGGVLASDKAGANEDSFCAALKAAIGRLPRLCAKLTLRRTELSGESSQQA